MEALLLYLVPRAALAPVYTVERFTLNFLALFCVQPAKPHTISSLAYKPLLSCMLFCLVIIVLF